MTTLSTRLYRLHSGYTAARKKLEARLNEDDSKPKRMRWSTFNRICEHIDERDERLGVDLAHLLAPKGMLDLNELVADGAPITQKQR